MRVFFIALLIPRLFGATAPDMLKNLELPADDPRYFQACYALVISGSPIPGTLLKAQEDTQATYHTIALGTERIGVLKYSPRAFSLYDKVIITRPLNTQYWTTGALDKTIVCVSGSKPVPFLDFLQRLPVAKVAVLKKAIIRALLEDYSLPNCQTYRALQTLTVYDMTVATKFIPKLQRNCGADEFRQFVHRWNCIWWHFDFIDPTIVAYLRELGVGMNVQRGQASTLRIGHIPETYRRIVPGDRQERGQGQGLESFELDPKRVPEDIWIRVGLQFTVPWPGLMWVCKEFARVFTLSRLLAISESLDDLRVRTCAAFTTYIFPTFQLNLELAILEYTSCGSIRPPLGENDLASLKRLATNNNA